jgi:hypothetical protein
VPHVSRLSDPSVLAAKRRPTEPSPKVRERNAAYAQYQELIDALVSDEDVFEVALDPLEVRATARARLLRIAGKAGKEIAVRKYGAGFAVGLMTPERRSARGRRRQRVGD